MRLITGAGVAGALMLSGGAPAVALTQSAALGDDTPPSQTFTADDADDTDADEPVEADQSDDVGETDETEATEPDETTDDTAEDTGVGGELGRAHALAMQAWTRCVNGAVSGPKTVKIDVQTVCGPKPGAPGRILQQLGLADDSTEPTDVTTDTETADTEESTEDSTGSPGWAAHHGWATSHSHHGSGHRGHHG